MAVFEPFNPTNGTAEQAEAPPKRKRGRPRRVAPPVESPKPRKRGRPKAQAAANPAPTVTARVPKASKVDGDAALVEELASRMARRPEKSRTKILQSLNRI